LNPDLSTYSLADFVPFTADVQVQLFRNYNQEWWPIQLFTLVLGDVILWAARSRVLGAKSAIVKIKLRTCWM